MSVYMCTSVSGVTDIYVYMCICVGVSRKRYICVWVCVWRKVHGSENVCGEAGREGYLCVYIIYVYVYKFVRWGEVRWGKSVCTSVWMCVSERWSVRVWWCGERGREGASMIYQNSRWKMDLQKRTLSAARRESSNGGKKVGRNRGRKGRMIGARQDP